MVTPWTWLTTRGRVVAVVGALLALAAWLTGQRDILVVACFLLAMPALALISVAIGRPRLQSDRRAEPDQVTVGQSFIQRIGLQRSGGIMLGTLLLEDRVPPALGPPPRFAVARPARKWTRHLSYRIVAEQRGRFRTGPLSVQTVDPFGMARIRRSFTATNDVLVLPDVAPLSDVSRATAAGLAGIADRMGTMGSDDVMVREYRAGDDVRRIHWRSSARSQQLMVRREEQARDLHVTLLTDTRAGSHTGAGRTSTLEWTISAAASIAVHCIDEDFALSLLTPPGPLCEHIRPLTVDHVLVAFAELTTTTRSDLPPVESNPTVGHKQGLMIACTGKLTVADVTTLLHTAGSQAGAVLACTADDNGDDRPYRLLEEAGWRVVRATPHTPITAAWLDLIAAEVAA